MLSEKPWRADEVILLLIRLFASMIIGMTLVGLLNSTRWLEEAHLKFLSVLIGTLSFHGMALALICAFLRKQGLTWEAAFGFGSPGLQRALTLALLAAIGALPIAWSLGHVSARIMESVHVTPVVQDPVQLLQTTAGLPTKLLIGVLAIVVAPFAEELVFRGLIYPTVKAYGFPRLALWGTSLLFASVHNNLMILIPLTFLAVVLTLLYETTGNLVAPILAHSTFNLVNFLWALAHSMLSTVPLPR